MGEKTISYKEINFSEAEICIGNKKFKYYISPLLRKNSFKHGFFTSSSSKKYIKSLSKQFHKNYKNCTLDQIHSDKIVFSSSACRKIEPQADGIFCNKFNQNLWIYTGDCMPIFFADKKKRFVAALHCGRKGLEKGIIKNIVKFFDKFGSCRDDLLVAVGPSISKKNYLVDKNIFKEFYEKNKSRGLIKSINKIEKSIDLANLIICGKEDSIQLDLRKYAYMHLLNENISSSNIEISNLCTYESDGEFNSWRRNKTKARQWSFISP